MKPVSILRWCDGCGNYLVGFDDGCTIGPCMPFGKINVAINLPENTYRCTRIKKFWLVERQYEVDLWTFTHGCYKNLTILVGFCKQTKDWFVSEYIPRG